MEKMNAMNECGVAVRERESRRETLRRAFALMLVIMMLGSMLLVLTGCYRRTVSRSGITTRHESDRVYQPNAPEPGTPILPWFNNDDDDDKDEDDR